MSLNNNYIQSFREKTGFSIIEILVALVVVSILTAAMAPIITKKLKSNAISVGSNSKDAVVELESDCSAWGDECALCQADRCSLCTKECNENEYVYTAECICKPCTDFCEECVGCNAKKCKQCKEGYGLNGAFECAKCGEGLFSDGSTTCGNCPENHYCSNGIKKECPSNSYASANSTSCTACTANWAHCATCNPRGCLTCTPPYKLRDGICKLTQKTVRYTTAGQHTLKLPAVSEEIIVTLVSGGGGGGAGSANQYTRTIVTTGTGNMTADATNFVNVVSNGVYTWTLPNAVKGKKIKFTACGGGGGNSNSVGGYGGYITNVMLPIDANESQLVIQIGASFASL